MTLPFDPNFALNAVLLAMLLVIAGAVIVTRKLLAAILLMGLYSLVSAVWLVVMDAADVAFTEAVVGAGVSTIVLLGAIVLARSDAAKPAWPRLVAPALVVLVVGGLLIYAASGLPDFGAPSSPANAYVGHIYLSDAGKEIGAPNVVTAVLASYRGFDTLGETVVIFAAGLGVALMLGFGERAAIIAPEPIDPAGEHNLVLRVAGKLLIPIIALFAFYVQFHGDLGPGGGFQAGVILAVSVILHALVFGLRETMRAIKPSLARSIATLGVLIYAGVGCLCILNGGTFLDYDFLLTPEQEAEIPGWLLAPGDHPSGQHPSGQHYWGQHFGILLIELGVLFTVAATMITIFYGFAGRALDLPKSEARR